MLVAASLAASAVALLALAAVLVLVFWVDPLHAQVAAAGYVEKTARVGAVELSYAEGPDNGPPLVLLHAQLLDWFSYARVLPELSKSFHVFDIDYPGHGATVVPADYPMTADRIGADLADFIQARIGAPVFVSGNSSGGLLATWLAANRPALVRAAVLEDPPLFSSEYPRIERTIAYRAFAASQAATRAHPADFLLFWIRQNAGFFRRQVAPGAASVLEAAVRIRKWAHPGEPTEIGLLRDDTVRMLLRGLDRYDPRFGAAFYEGTWNAGFDHAQALARIECPTLLIHANYELLPDGTLNGAMDDHDDERALALLRHGQGLRVSARHVVNLDDPGLFVATLRAFFLGERDSMR